MNIGALSKKKQKNIKNSDLFQEIEYEIIRKVLVIRFFLK